jgi:hypothetical protein
VSVCEERKKKDPDPKPTWVSGFLAWEKIKNKDAALTRLLGVWVRKVLCWFGSFALYLEIKGQLLEK